MTPNDTQIDVLLRRQARRRTSSFVTDHLDADELNAFAEGSLPAPTRARFISHLADCDDCRELATNLVQASGAASTTLSPSATSARPSWQEKFANLFAPARLRYAAFAIVLIAAAGVTFLALRNRQVEPVTERNGASVATAPAQVSKQEPNEEEKLKAQPYSDRVASASPGAREPLKQPTPSDAKEGETIIAQNTQPTAPKSGIVTAAKPQPTLSAAQPSKTELSPSFAPPPPNENERAQNRARDTQSVGGIAVRKDEAANTKFGAVDRMQSNTVQRDRSNTQEGTSNANLQSQISRQAQEAPYTASVQAERRVTDDKALAKNKQSDTPSATTGRANEQLRIEGARPAASAAKRAPVPAVTEEKAESRSVRGRKFRKQGAAWIDSRFKSSMPVKSISRGSADYLALDSGLRSIAEELGGDVLIVWKGKAYRIH